MRTLQPKNLDELLSVKNSIRRDGWSPYLAFYRGQIFDWPIKPNITRNENLRKGEILEIEKSFFENFNEQTLDIKILDHFEGKNTKFAQQWHNLFQAQHLGFYTRLTDWTQSFEHAMFFAIDDTDEYKIEESGVIWIYKCPYDNNQLINFNRDDDYKYFEENPFQLDKAYLVKHYTQFPENFEDFVGEMRRFRQDGSFIISTSAELTTPIEEIEYIQPHLEKVIISKELKKEIKDYIAPTLSEYLYYSSQDETKNSEEKLKIIELTKKKNKELYWNK